MTGEAKECKHYLTQEKSFMYCKFLSSKHCSYCPVMTSKNVFILIKKKIWASGIYAEYKLMLVKVCKALVFGDMDMFQICIFLYFKEKWANENQKTWKKNMIRNMIRNESNKTHELSVNEEKVHMQPAEVWHVVITSGIWILCSIAG